MSYQRSTSELLEGWRQNLFDAKKTSLTNLKAIFDHVDTDGSGKVDDREFEMCLNTFGLFLGQADQNALFRTLDTDGSGYITYNELVSAMLQPLSGERADIVDQAWASLGGDELTSADVCARCDATQHPLVVTGDWPAEKVTDQILMGMPSNVSKADFVDYFTDYSACIPEIETEYFTTMVGKMFGIKGGAAAVETGPLLKALADRLGERIRPTLSEMQILQKGWSYVDTDESKDITPSEFAKMMEEFGFPLTDAQVDACVGNYGDGGRVTWSKFSGAMKPFFGAIAGFKFSEEKN